ncbi:MFS transporter [Luedemannella flava]
MGAIVNVPVYDGPRYGAGGRVAGTARPPARPLGYVATLVGLATSFVSPFLPLFLSRELHAGPARVALFLFLMPLAAVGVATVVGRLSDRPGARPRLLVLGAATGIVGYALFAIFRNYWAALAVALSLVAIAGSLLPQVFAFSRGLLDRVNPARAAAGINALRAVFSLSWVAGPPLAAYLIGVVDFRGLFLVAALMHVAILPVFLRFGAKAGARRQAAPAAVVDLAPAAAFPAAADQRRVHPHADRRQPRRDVDVAVRQRGPAPAGQRRRPRAGPVRRHRDPAHAAVRRPRGPLVAAPAGTARARRPASGTSPPWPPRRACGRWPPRRCSTRASSPPSAAWASRTSRT